MFRNVLSLSALVLALSACSTLDPLTESPFPSNEENCDSTEDGTETGDTAEVEDTGSDTGEETDDPCTVSVQWSAEVSAVLIDSFSMPRVEVVTTCSDGAIVENMEIYFSTDRWLEEVGDTRLGVGTEYEHVGVFSATELKCQQDRCGAMWDIDPTSFSSARSTPEYTASFGFSLAAFSSDEISEIDELWNDDADEVILTAVVTVNEVEYVVQSTLVIVAE